MTVYDFIAYNEFLDTKNVYNWYTLYTKYRPNDSKMAIFDT